MSEKKPTLSQQIAAVWLGHDILAGRKSPNAKERAYAAPHLEAAARTLEYVRDHEFAFKRSAEAVEMLRKARLQLPGGDLQDEIRAFLAEIDGGAR